MLLTCAISILLVPAFAHAAAFEWSLPEPTAHAAPDNWSPAPTPAPLLSGASLSRRQISQGDNTCGFVSGSSRTCPSTSFILHTNSPSQNPQSHAPIPPSSAQPTPSSASMAAVTRPHSPHATSPQHASPAPPCRLFAPTHFVPPTRSS
jgi:hypothetical protein